MRALEEGEAVRARLSKKAAGEADAAKTRFERLVDEFLTRMNGALNPGSYDGPGGVRGWSLLYERNAEKDKSLWLTFDGRMPYSESVMTKKLLGGKRLEHRSGLRDFRDMNVKFRPEQLDQLGKSMAGLLKQYDA